MHRRRNWRTLAPYALTILIIGAGVPMAANAHNKTPASSCSESCSWLDDAVEQVTQWLDSLANSMASTWVTTTDGLEGSSAETPPQDPTEEPVDPNETSNMGFSIEPNG